MPHPLRGRHASVQIVPHDLSPKRARCPNWRSPDMGTSAARVACDARQALSRARSRANGNGNGNGNCNCNCNCNRQIGPSFPRRRESMDVAPCCARSNASALSRGSLSVTAETNQRPLLLTLADAMELHRCPALLSQVGTVPKLAALRHGHLFGPLGLRCSASFKSHKNKNQLPGDKMQEPQQYRHSREGGNPWTLLFASQDQTLPRVARVTFC